SRPSPSCGDAALLPSESGFMPSVVWLIGEEWSLAGRAEEGDQYARPVRAERKIVAAPEGARLEHSCGWSTVDSAPPGCNPADGAKARCARWRYPAILSWSRTSVSRSRCDSMLWKARSKDIHAYSPTVGPGWTSGAGQSGVPACHAKGHS